MLKPMVAAIFAGAVCTWTLAAAPQSAISEWRKGLPYSEKGFGVLCNQYCNGRISGWVAHHGGLYRVFYAGGQKMPRHLVFRNEEYAIFGKLARVQVLVDDVPYRLVYEKTTHYPYGYVSECTLDGVRIGHELVFDRNAVLQRVKVLANPQGRKVRARIVQSGHMWEPMEGRTHANWEVDPGGNRIVASFADKTEGCSFSCRTAIGLAGAKACFPLNGPKAKPQFFKWYVEAADPADEFVFHLAFDPKDGEDFSAARVDRVHRHFAEIRANGATFETGSPALDSALSGVVSSVASHELELPGAYRASPWYWVWGWDAMVYADACVLGGDPEGVRRLLYFIRDHASARFGIMHEYQPDFSNSDSGKLVTCVQPLYAILLNNYWRLTGDRKTLEDCLPFCRQIVERARREVRPGESLVRCYDFFPDNPFSLGQSLTNDFSAIDNSVYVQGLCAWRELTGEGADVCAKAKSAFERLIWDEQEGFWSDWADGDTLRPVPIYPVFGQLAVSPHCLDMKRAELPRIAAYMKRHFLTRYGIRMLDLNSPGYMQDGGQQGEYFPVTERYYWMVMNAVGDVASIEDFRRIHAAYAAVCSYPEGQTLEVENTDPSEYEDNPGMKQIFTAKSWLASALDLWLGLKVEEKGLRFHPMNDGKPFAVRNLLVRGKRLNVKVSGTGARATFRLNGKPLEDGFLPYAALVESNNLLEVLVK